MRLGCIERGVTKLKNVRKAVFLFDLRVPHPWAVCFGMDSLCSRVSKCWKFFKKRTFTRPKSERRNGGRARVSTYRVVVL